RLLREPADRLEVDRVVAGIAPPEGRDDDAGDARHAPRGPLGLDGRLRGRAPSAAPPRVARRSARPRRRAAGRGRGGRRRDGRRGGSVVTYALIAYAATVVLWIAWVLVTASRTRSLDGE